uniref:BD-FAE-like domain-containing protein n=1 Tax=Odontella aurita TaxID=265563 RepID=A0A7S4JTP5_9STRA|mmetsp:Transcript_53906/g.161301  ORF Transcript_53906/g.161301 Transcript_53906/m.161301 type:complete len:578 (+) Transcript_53906:506-2239(+)
MPPRHSPPGEEEGEDPSSNNNPPDGDGDGDGDIAAGGDGDGDKQPSSPRAVSSSEEDTILTVVDDDCASASLLSPLLPPSKTLREEIAPGAEDEDDDDEEDVDDDETEAEADCLRRCHFSLRYHLALIFRLTPQLLRFLLCGTPRWMFKLMRLVSFVVCLLPAFVRFAWYYWISGDRVVSSYKCVFSSVGGGGMVNGTTSRGTSRHLADVYGSRTPAPAPAENADGNGDGNGNEEESPPLKPVVIFLTGGAWIIGYKMWGALLARALVPFGVLVIIPDYRNFPQTNVAGMVADVDESIQWTLDNCRRYGGDPDKVVLVGQSAGAHLGSCAVTIKCLLELDPAARATYPLATTYSPKSIRGFIPMSGPYDIVQMQPHLHKHGLDKNLVRAIFGGGGDNNKLERYSPVHIAKKCAKASQRNRNRNRKQGKGKTDGEGGGDAPTMEELLPPTKLIHGTIDKTVPWRECEDFASALLSACSTNGRKKDADGDADADASLGGATTTRRISTLLYEGWSHTDPILEGPMIGDQRFHREVYDRVKQWTGRDEAGMMGEFDDDHPVCRRMCPTVLVWLGRIFNPF